MEKDGISDYLLSPLCLSFLLCFFLLEKDRSIRDAGSDQKSQGNKETQL